MRNLSIQRIQRRSPGRVPELAAFATSSATRTAVVLINRRIDRALAVRLPGLAARGAVAEALTGPSPMADNEHAEQVRIVDIALRDHDQGLGLTLPPHSVTVVDAAR